MNYKQTLNLPQTNFPMKANLIQKELEILQYWHKINLNSLIRKMSKGKKKYILHDGPPYANGNIHLGTAFNKILKDIIVKSKNMSNYESIYVPGWDCHGLPIEHEVVKKMKKTKNITLSLIEQRHNCRNYAKKFFHLQREQFKKLGIFAEWDEPYLTMSHEYESIIVNEFSKLILNGDIYKGKKPVYWCPICKTALAEAEIEYCNHLTPSIFIKFLITSDLSKICSKIKNKNIDLLVWTTTPWTLIANKAIAINKDYQYAFVQTDKGIFIIAEKLINYCMKTLNIKKYLILDMCLGSKLEGFQYKHPFLDQYGSIILASFVTLEVGTGIVHIAPGHGQEDYEIGITYGLENYSPVDENGKFTSDVKNFAGQFIFDANKTIINKLNQCNSLLKEIEIKHSYPHCWRCKNPIIFRSTAQWFLSMDRNNIRANTLKIIDSVKWIPSWTRDRIYTMIANRPDWCISRQRIWGVPIIIFYCTICNHILLNKEIFHQISLIISEYGADIWFEKEANELLPLDIKCDLCGNNKFKKETDILDVWFDSGVSYAAVLETRPYLSFPADLYLEGNDQHRGWFHSSLIECVATRNQAPYKKVITHGFVVDKYGKKMSKSVGNTISPEEIINNYGAEILRLWVASEDYTVDIRISDEILQRLIEAYRRIRNTCRFILGNLYDFKYDENMNKIIVDYEIDRWILSKLQSVIEKVKKFYLDYQIYMAYYTIYNFCNIELSSIYLDISKERLYTSKANSTNRKSVQQTMFILLDTLIKLLAPILTFTTEEIWNHLSQIQNNLSKSIHLTQFPAINNELIDKKLNQKFKLLFQIRNEVLKAMEIARKEKIIGHTLDANVEFIIKDNMSLKLFLKENNKLIQQLCIVSSINISNSLKEKIYESTNIKGLEILISKAKGQKCHRCWVIKNNVGLNQNYPELCLECIDNISHD